MTWSRPGEIGPHERLNVRARTRIINESGADLLIDIHCNAGGAFTGPQTFYWDGAPSYVLARHIQEELRYLTHTRRSVSRIDQYVLRHVHMPAVNVEAGFITNPREEALLATPAYQEKLSWAIFVGAERWMIQRRSPARTEIPPEHAEMLVR
jgi:N-acetylmuramoyl-L-alanine amidase